MMSLGNIYARTGLRPRSIAAVLLGLLVLAGLAQRHAERPEEVLFQQQGRASLVTLEQHQIAGQSPLVDSGREDALSGSRTESASSRSGDGAARSTYALLEMNYALEVMQRQYFEIWQGAWPDAIDWTSAVLGTYVSGALTTFSSAFDYVIRDNAQGEQVVAEDEGQLAENLINKFFSQLTTFYFGQDAFGLRTQANDDMLWVVLGWLDAIKFINLHSYLHYDRDDLDRGHKGSSSGGWYGNQLIPAFAHRARIFWDLAAKGYDTKYCGGGIVWSPYLEPYKNAITNELFIAASVSMYLYFPGDDNPSPFSKDAGLPPAKAHDTKYLDVALQAFNWLAASNMTNAEGLYVDGFHISGYRNATRNNTKCDLRNEMVYTYNQGVLLTGYRGLWESTGAGKYLDGGHRLIQSVIRATGWQEPGARQETSGRHNLTRWAGLGRDGILEEVCDASGRCSQNGQTFKGIFFHHLTYFCTTLPSKPLNPGYTFAADAELSSLHAERCAAYAGWIRHNAQAALKTRNQEGEFGSWWGAYLLNHTDIDLTQENNLPGGAVDYRNGELPPEQAWRGVRILQDHIPGASPAGPPQQPIRDVNDRGRGRTVETQGGGIAVSRALWEMVEGV